MLSAMFWFVAGLLVGWNILPQPTWVKDFIDNVWTTLKTKVFPKILEWMFKY